MSRLKELKADAAIRAIIPDLQVSGAYLATPVSLETVLSA